MNYKDYVGLKLQNFSKADFENLNQMNFASDSTGYMRRVTKDLKPKEENKEPPKRPNKFSQKTPDKPKPPSETQQALANASKSALAGLSKQQSSSSSFKSFDPNASSNKSNSTQQTSKNNQATTSPSKSSSNSPASSSSTANSQSSSSASSKQSSSSQSTSNETKTVKNWYGKNVEFEKRDGKWYRSGTNEEVSKTGKWKSYFDEKSGVKNVKRTSGKSYNPNGKVTAELQSIDTQNDTYVDKLGNVVHTTKSDAEMRNQANKSGLRKVDEVNKTSQKTDTNKTTQPANNGTQDKKYDKDGKPILDVSNQHANYQRYSDKYLDMLLKEGRIEKSEYDKEMAIRKKRNNDIKELASRMSTLY